MTIRQRSYKETSQRHLKDTCIQCNSSFKTPLKSSRHGVERVILKGVVLDEERDFEKKKKQSGKGDGLSTTVPLYIYLTVGIGQNPKSQGTMT